jgi:hypothetical protein
MAASQCWLKGMDVINAADYVMTRLNFNPGARKANVHTLRQAIESGASAQLNKQGRCDAINLTEFILPSTFGFCRRLAQASDHLKSRLRGVPIAHVHQLYQFPLLQLFLNALNRDGKTCLRAASEGRQSIFEGATECSCAACTQLLQQSVVLTALRDTALMRKWVHWKPLMYTVFRAGYVMPYAALLLYIKSATAALESTETWQVHKLTCSASFALHDDCCDVPGLCLCSATPCSTHTAGRGTRLSATSKFRKQ